VAGVNDDAQRTTEPGKADDAVPRLPRGRGIRLSRPELLRIAGLAILLVFLIVTQRPCASAVSKFVTSFGDQGSAAAAMPRPGTIDPTGEAPRPAGRAVGVPTPRDTASPIDPTASPIDPPGSAPPAGSATSGSGSATGDAPGLDGYEHLRPGMTDAEIKAVIDRARARTTDRPGSAGGAPR